MEQLKPEQIIATVKAWGKEKRDLFADMILIAADREEPRKNRENALESLFSGEERKYCEQLMETGFAFLQSVKAAQ